MNQQVDRFIDHLRFEKRYSANTLAAYQRDLTRFAQMTDLPVEDVRNHHVDAFTARLHSSGLAPRSIQRALSSVRSFFNCRRIRLNCLA